MPGRRALGILTSPKENVPRPVQRAISPTIMPKSPTRLTMNALLAALEAFRARIETDEEVRADAHQFPEHEHHGHVARDHQPQHAEAEQRKVLVEAGESPGRTQRPAVGERGQRVGHFLQLFVHVAEGVDVDARATSVTIVNMATVRAST